MLAPYTCAIVLSVNKYKRLRRKAFDRIKIKQSQLEQPTMGIKHKARKMQRYYLTTQRHNNMCYYFALIFISATRSRGIPLNCRKLYAHRAAKRSWCDLDKGRTHAPTTWFYLWCCFIVWHEPLWCGSTYQLAILGMRLWIMDIFWN